MVRLVVQAANTGNGVFACEDIAAGELVCCMTGKRLTTSQTEAAIEDGSLRADDPLQVGEESFVWLDHVPYSFNHSCDPNAGIRRGQRLCALRDIKKGEEITYDYSTTVCTHSSWSMLCLCGSVQCRLIIKNARSLPKTRRVYYLSQKVLPRFIAKELAPKMPGSPAS